MHVNYIIFVLSVFSSIITPSLAVTCSKTDTCTCSTANGHTLDMSSLGSQSISIGIYTYYPCSTNNPSMGESCSGDYAICQNGLVLGKHSTSTFDYNVATDEVTVTYPGGVYGDATVILRCTTSTPSLNYLEAEYTNNKWIDKFEMSSSAACVIIAGGNAGNGGGFEGFALFLILLLLIFVGIPAYLGGFILYLYFVKQSRGLDLLPHTMFWKDVPFLIRDGFYFTFSPIYKPLRDKLAPPQDYAFI